MSTLLPVLLAAGLVTALLALHGARVHLRRQVARHALHDSVTSLPGREIFKDRAEVALARGRRHGCRVAVLFIDLDRFKTVNESLGYEQGDQLLSLAARRIEGCLREADTAARLGSDQFTVLLEEVADGVGAARVARRILDAFCEPFALGGHEAFVGASIGVAVAGSRSPSVDELVRSADLAMQRAKELGKGRYELFEPAMMAKAARRLMLEADLRRAVDNDELRLVYEPEVLLHSGEVRSLEALLRWEHPTQGLLQPASFIPLAEDTGLIVAIGRWVLEEACRAARRLHASRPAATPVRLSVNVSARQLERPESLTSEVASVLTATGLRPDLLTLEITESVLMRHSRSAVAAVQGLRDLGVEIAIDDFGTGYSSLAYLKHFPVTGVKLDRSFVQGVTHPVDSAIVRSVIQLADWLGASVTAEGIESGDQLCQLRRMGCAVGQGFYLSRPVAEDDLAELLDGSRWEGAFSQSEPRLGPEADEADEAD
ncbi:MAG: EAL domain-containing protein, partial [Actinomycetota bacterium]|nr:EAL domain-containing protein [Actinomycetota bacterium]